MTSLLDALGTLLRVLLDVLATLAVLAAIVAVRLWDKRSRSLDGTLHDTDQDNFDTWHEKEEHRP